jgi:DNA polymerase-3 subunit epsilon
MSVPDAMLRYMNADCDTIADATSTRWVAVDVETNGTDSAHCRIISIAALAVAADGTIEDSVVSLIDADADPGPTEIHGLNRQMLTGQPRFCDLAPHLVDLLRGRILVAHNVAFDYAFLATEAARAGIDLPTTTVMCTVELASHLDLDVDNLKLATLARHWGIQQTRPHDALDDALVLSHVLVRELALARRGGIPLPIRPPWTLVPPVFNSSPAAA